MSHVLIKKSHTAPRRIYHEPSDENPDKPKCDHDRKGGIEFVRKRRSDYPNARLCKNCSGGVDRANEGPKLSAKLEKMNPEAI